MEDVPAPTPAAGEVLLDVEWCGICGTDIEEYREGPIVIPSAAPHPLTGRQAPLTLGHEFAGRVRRLGPGVGGLAVGERVAVEVCLACGECAFCRSRRPALCVNWAAYGLQADGGLAEAVLVRAENCLPLPPAIDQRSAALIEPTEVAVRAVHKLALREAESAVVLGGGTIGLLTAQVLRAVGAHPVLVVTSSGPGTAAADELGFDVLQPTGDMERAVRARLDGDGPDVVVECQGRTTSARDAIRLAKRGGRIVLVGIVPGDAPVDILDLTIGEKTVVGSVQHELEADLRPTLRLLESGAVVTAPLVTGDIPLDRVVGEGLDPASPRQSVKTLVRTH